jgi:myo-inositol-1(or 4)-monophosphatase
LPENDLALLTDAAREAGEVAKSFFQRNPDVTHKPDGAGPVTEADLAVDTMLATVLQNARADYGWLSEETEDGAARLSTARQFVIDPIDGTRAFIDGSKDWAHSLAIIEDGCVTDAVIYLPMHDLMFTAALGTGAFCNGVAINATQVAMQDATVLGARPNFEPRFWKGGAVPPIKRAFRSSLAYRLALVAQGRFDGMLTLRPSWEWDIAAGALIVTEAGGTATDQHGAPLRFNNPHPQVPGVLTGGAQLHADLLARLEPTATNP